MLTSFQFFFFILSFQGYSKEPELFDLTQYNSTVKVKFSFQENEMNKLQESLNEHPLVFSNAKIIEPVVAICPFFNLRSMKDDRRERDARNILGLIHSSPNYASNDGHANHISKALFNGIINQSYRSQEIRKYLSTSEVLPLPEDMIQFIPNKTKFKCFYDCLEAVAHSKFTGVKDSDNYYKEFVEKMPKYFLIKKVEHTSAGWPSFESVSITVPS